nr:hypothetical protein BgiMline_010470 [Biomphalaria glabrata]
MSCSIPRLCVSGPEVGFVWRKAMSSFRSRDVDSVIAENLKESWRDSVCVCVLGDFLTLLQPSTTSIFLKPMIAPNGVESLLQTLNSPKLFECDQLLKEKIGLHNPFEAPSSSSTMTTSDGPMNSSRAHFRPPSLLLEAQ